MELDLPRGSAALLDRFVAEAEALSAEVFVEPTAEAVRERVRVLCDGARILAWSETHLPLGVGEALGGATLLSSEAPLRERARADVGLTGADGAVASIGALILGCRAGRSRDPSVLPPLHVAVLRRGDIHPDLASALDATAELRRTCSSVHLIAGPSRTADIELCLTLGVHGPGRVVIVVGP